MTADDPAATLGSNSCPRQTVRHASRAYVVFPLLWTVLATVFRPPNQGCVNMCAGHVDLPADEHVFRKGDSADADGALDGNLDSLWFANCHLFGH